MNSKHNVVLFHTRGKFSSFVEAEVGFANRGMNLNVALELGSTLTKCDE